MASLSSRFAVLPLILSSVSFSLSPCQNGAVLLPLSGAPGCFSPVEFCPLLS